jgi:hypothetical protein
MMGPSTDRPRRKKGKKWDVRNKIRKQQKMLVRTTKQNNMLERNLS